MAEQFVYEEDTVDMLSVFHATFDVIRRQPILSGLKTAVDPREGGS